MSLEDFLGSTPKIKIIDFLAENMDYSYNEIELSRFTKLSRAVINQKILELTENNIIILKGEQNELLKYQLADNDIVKYLTASVLQHSFRQGER